MDGASETVEQIAELLDADKLEMSKATYQAVERLLSIWEADLREDAKEDGKTEGYDEALKNENIVNDDTMADLETGLKLLKDGDTLSAPVYLDRALRDLGSSYY